MAFTDNSCPPVGQNLTYERGDGAKVDMRIIPPGQPALVDPAVCPVPADGRQRVKTSAKVVIPTGVPLKINPNARVNVRGQPPASSNRPGTNQQFTDEAVMDHPAVGGKYTVFILFYGDYHDLHRKCLTSLLASVPARRIDLRVGTNMVCQATLDMIAEYQKQGFITKHYYHADNAYKYPVMREMFWDDSCPITTKWVLWFDDDSICDVDPNWLNYLSVHIAQHHRGNDAHMIGANFVWSPNKKTRDILASRPWYKGKPWRAKNGKPSPNGNNIIFVTGGFWALTTEALRAADVPDLGTGLTHTGGDWQIGEQIYQAGYGLKQFNGQKQFVRTSSVDRRGATQPTIDQVGTPAVVQQPSPALPPVTPPTAAPQPPPAVPRLRRIIEL